MPCLKDSGEAYTESEEIAKYLEYFYPSPTLSLQDTPELVEQVMVNDLGKPSLCNKAVVPCPITCVPGLR